MFYHRDLDRIAGTLEASLDHIEGMQDPRDIVSSKGSHSTLEVAQGHLLLPHHLKDNLIMLAFIIPTHGPQGRPSQRYNSAAE